MATLQKFKLLATQCAVAGSPSRSPTTSPVIHLRRRKTLRMLLGRRRHDGYSPDRRFSLGERIRAPEKDNKEICVRNKLKDLFVSSPPEKVPENVRERLLLPEVGGGGVGGGPRLLRPLSATIRQRLLRRAWRPVLGAIPE